MELLPVGIQDQVVPHVRVNEHDVVAARSGRNVVRLQKSHSLDDSRNGDLVVGGHGTYARSAAAVQLARLGHQSVTGHDVVGLGRLSRQGNTGNVDQIMQGGVNAHVGVKLPVTVLLDVCGKGGDRQLGGIGRPAFLQRLGVGGVGTVLLEELVGLALALGNVDLLCVLVVGKVCLGLAQKCLVLHLGKLHGNVRAFRGVHIGAAVLGDDHVSKQAEVEYDGLDHEALILVVFHLISFPAEEM